MLNIVMPLDIYATKNCEVSKIIGESTDKTIELLKFTKFKKDKRQPA
jgi:hypothetical protein